ncbi:site-2 protease family protein [Actinacidiphila acidipaludis]|uniref:Zinc metalloprotease n=1 Tax=Actinacidiphila acidipaludis TaxID=2873382 RepID=A0ABS7QCZ0_9ACTN|nr:site-2 protease family protein [Streptomyces acidipaludis]MBY8880992.1 site-2 protease family protein [Streptomyces acidipaludis]
MSGSFRIGRIFGVPLRLHWSVPVLLVVIGYGLGSGTLRAWVPDRSSTVYAACAALGTVLLAASLLLHEAAHAVVARRSGIDVEDVTLWALGGVTRMGRARQARVALTVAISGPVVSLVIGGAVLGAAVGLHPVAGWSLPAALLAWLGWANLLIGVFNLLPAVPLDGGRVLHAVIWLVTGDRDRSEMAADRGGQIVGALIVAAGWLLILRGAPGALWLAVIGLFITFTAGVERKRVAVNAALRGVRVGDAMSSPVTTASDWLTVERFLEGDAGQSGHAVLPLTDLNGSPTGVVALRDAAMVPADRRADIRLRDIAAPLSQCTVARPDDELNEVVQGIRTRLGLLILVMDGLRLVGIVTPRDLDHLFERRATGRTARGPAAPPRWR